MCTKDAEVMANSEDPDQTDLELHCLSRPVCLKTWDHIGSYVSFQQADLSPDMTKPAK